MTQQTLSDNTIKIAFDQSTERFLAIALWVGILLNVAFSISDWVVMKSYFLPFLIFRLAVSLGSMVTLLLYKRLKWTIYPCLFILVAGISIQNA